MKHMFTVVFIIMVASMSSSEPNCKKPCYCNEKKKTAACNSRHLRFIPRLPGYIEIVKFVENNFSAIDRNFFKNLTQYNHIVSLNLTDNLILQISDDAFQDFRYLTTLEISKEHNLNVTSLKRSFGSLNNSEIQYVYLTNNGWQNLSSDIFTELKYSKISWVSLASNILHTLKGRMFSYLKHLKILNLANNLISHIDLNGLESLEQLYLIRNNLHSIPSWCNGTKSLLPNLQVCRLESNSISEMDHSSFTCLPNLQDLRLDYNNFRFLRNNTFSSLVRLKKLHISHNTRLESIYETALNITSLESFYFQHNNFHFDKSNKYNHKTLFTYCPRLTTIDFSNNYLPSMKKTFILRKLLLPLTKIQKLTLPSTRIRNLPLDLFPRFKSLKTLNLQGNFISGWNNSESIFGKKSSLVTLNLQANNIRLINQTTFPKSLLASLKNLDISDNYFACTCDQMWFRDWIRHNVESKKINLTLNGYPSHYVCMFPGELKGVLLEHYQPTKELCEKKNPFTTVVIAMAGVVILAITVVLVLYRCQTNIKNYIYVCRFYKNKTFGYVRLDSEENYEYHAFIVYCEADEDWVHKVCLKKLENEEGMKVCIHQRDFDVGASVTGNIGKYMRKCRKILVVMSNDFVESEWCQWEVDLVQERRRQQGRDVALLVMLKPIDSRHMTDSLKTLLDTTDHVLYSEGFGESLFWKLLIQQLRKPFGHPPVAVL